MHLKTRVGSTLKRRHAHEEGATLVLITVMMVALLGMAAISIDFAVASSDKKQAQNAADAAALSIARECANKTSNCTTSGATSEIAWALSQNAPGKSGSAAPAVTYANKQVSVTVAGARRSMFAQVLGDNTLDVRSRASASWGHVAVEGDVDLPVAIGYCDWQAANPGGVPGGVTQEYVFGNVSNFLGILNPGCNIDATTIPAAAGRRAYNASPDLLQGNRRQLGWVNGSILGWATNCNARIQSWNRWDVWAFNLFSSQKVCDTKGQALQAKFQADQAAGRDTVILVPVFGIQNWHLNVFGIFQLTGTQQLNFHGFAPFKLEGFLNKRADTLTGNTLVTSGIWQSNSCRFDRAYNFWDIGTHRFDKCIGYRGKWIRTTRPIAGWEYDNEYNHQAPPDFGATKVTLIE